jgi:hypothetical protein
MTDFTIFNAELSTQKYITSPFICIILCSDFPTAFLGPAISPSPNVKRGVIPQ